MLLRLLLIALLSSVALLSAACGTTETTEDPDESPYTDYDVRVKETMLTERQLEFFESQFRSDRAEMDEYVEAFASEEIGPKLHDELVALALEASDPVFAANWAYLLKRAGFDEVDELLVANLVHEEPYVRFRAVWSIPPDEARPHVKRLIAMASADEPSAMAREAAQGLLEQTATTGDLSALWTALGTPAVGEADGDTRAFFEQTMDDLLAGMDPGEARRALTDMGNTEDRSPAQEQFLLRTLLPVLGPENLDWLADVYAGTDNAADSRELALQGLQRLMTADGARVSDERTAALRTALVADLMARRFDNATVTGLLQEIGLEGEPLDQLVAWLDGQSMSAPEAVATLTLLAGMGVHSRGVCELMIRALDRPGLQEMAIDALARILRTTPPDMSDVPRGQIIAALALLLQSPDRATVAHAAAVLTRTADEAGPERVVHALGSDRRTTVEACSEALLAVAPADRARLAEHEVRMCELVRISEDGHHAPDWQMEAVLKVLAEIGTDLTVEFLQRYCKPGDASIDAGFAIDDAMQRLEERLGG